MKTSSANKEEKIRQELIKKLEANGFGDYKFEINRGYEDRLVDMIVTKDGIRVMAFEFKSNCPNIKPLIEQFGAYNLEIPLYLATLEADKLSIKEYKNGQLETILLNNITPRMVSFNIKEKAIEKFETQSSRSKKLFKSGSKVNRRIWYLAASLCLIYLIVSIIAMNTKCLYLPLDMSVILWISLIAILSLIPHILEEDDAGKHLREVLRLISKLIYSA